MGPEAGKEGGRGSPLWLSHVYLPQVPLFLSSTQQGRNTTPLSRKVILHSTCIAAYSSEERLFLWQPKARGGVGVGVGVGVRALRMAGGAFVLPGYGFCVHLRNPFYCIPGVSWSSKGFPDFSEWAVCPG